MSSFGTLKILVCQTINKGCAKLSIIHNLQTQTTKYKHVKTFFFFLLFLSTFATLLKLKWEEF
jgi:hypothetical protein